MKGILNGKRMEFMKNKIGVAKHAVLFLVITMLYMLVRYTFLDIQSPWIRFCMIASIIMLLIANAYLYRRKRWSEKTAVISIIAAGIIMRIGYMLYTGCEVRSHDMYGFSSDEFGHAGYILTLIETNKLPESNHLQLYQQPFYYIVAAFVSKIINGILQSRGNYDLVDAAKVVSCFASCSSLLLINNICDLANVKGKGKLVAISIVSFLPGFYLIGGRVNPDALALFFMILAIDYTLRWHNDTSLKNTLILSIIYGCGMMTKISCGVIAIFTATIFMVHLIQGIKRKKYLELILKYIIFGCISLPLGLWYSIRNYLKFGQSLTYVLMQDKTSTIYCGDRSFVQRFLSVNVNNLLETPYAEPFDDYNFPVYLTKTALFGEFEYETPKIIVILLLITGVMIVAFFVCSFIWQWIQIIKKKTDMEMTAYIAILSLEIISAVGFCIKYAFGCSMDFRYYGIMAILFAVLLGDMIERRNNNFVTSMIIKVTILFGIFSCCMYVMI